MSWSAQHRQQRLLSLRRQSRRCRSRPMATPPLPMRLLASALWTSIRAPARSFSLSVYAQPMRKWAFLLTLGAGSVAHAACVGDDPVFREPTAGMDGGPPALIEPDAGPRESGAAESGTPTDACKSIEKSCAGKCVALGDPSYGCDPKLCAAACEASAANTVAVCKDFACAINCADGFADCDGDLANGCEVRTSEDPSNCGTCANSCGAANSVTRACLKGRCEFTCQPGFGHCLANDATGCETATNASDTKNCGACGRDCVGGTCTAGACSIVTLNTGLKPIALALDATYVYFASDETNQILRVSKDGGCAAAPCSGTADLLPTGNVSNPQAIATDGKDLFWANYLADGQAKLRRATVGGASPGDVGDSYGTFSGALTIASGKQSHLVQSQCAHGEDCKGEYRRNRCDERSPRNARTGRSRGGRYERLLGRLQQRQDLQGGVDRGGSLHHGYQLRDRSDRDELAARRGAGRDERVLRGEWLLGHDQESRKCRRTAAWSRPSPPISSFRRPSRQMGSTCTGARAVESCARRWTHHPRAPAVTANSSAPPSAQHRSRSTIRRSTGSTTVVRRTTSCTSVRSKGASSRSIQER